MPSALTCSSLRLGSLLIGRVHITASNICDVLFATTGHFQVYQGTAKGIGATTLDIRGLRRCP